MDYEESEDSEDSDGGDYHIKTSKYYKLILMMVTLLQGMFPLNSKIKLLWDRQCLLIDRNVYKCLVKVKSISMEALLQ